MTDHRELAVLSILSAIAATVCFVGSAQPVGEPCQQWLTFLASTLVVVCVITGFLFLLITVMNVFEGLEQAQKTEDEPEESDEEQPHESK